MLERRARHVAVLTDDGNGLLDELRADHVAPAGVFHDSLDEDDVAQLSELLGRLPGVLDGLCADDE